MKFPIDAPRRRVIRALELLGFVIIRDHEHTSMVRQNEDGTRTPLTLPGHSTLKSSTIRTMLHQSKLSREDFLKSYEQA